MSMERNVFDAAEQRWKAVPPDPGAENVSGFVDQRLVDLWALVLEARFIPCRTERSGRGRILLVPEERFSEAIEELRLFQQENRNWPPPLPVPRTVAENTLAALSVLLLLATFYNITQLHLHIAGLSPPDWITAGGADAGLIRDGQWWRAVTALTLHSDPVHLLGNILIGAVFIVLLCQELGSGPAWCLLILSGTLGNLANALLQSHHHVSIGASTLVFGAIGILGSLRLAQWRRQGRRRWLMPVAGSVALLAMLGAEGENTDLGAHLFGFAFGTLLGLIAYCVTRSGGLPGRRLNALLSLAAALTPVAAWWAALSGRW